MRHKNQLLFLLILITGSVLRLLFINELPFTYDEFSAMSRLHFNSFSGLIEKGVMIDGHPAGVQVFLYYWTMCFGWSEIAIKLPFIFMGILSIWFIYLIGKEWYNESVGLISAAFIATMQFPIMYSQIARPYASGMFLCLAMVYFWSRLIFKPATKYWFNFSMYVLFSALCAYNHHFSLLFAAIVGLTGLFFIRKKQLLYYILSGVAIFILYIPHLRIFFYQLNMGGVEGWLSKPHSNFIVNFVEYLFHYSSLVYLMVVVLIAFGFYRRNEEKYNFRLLVVSVAWFLLPIIIGFLYSKYVSSVLQASMLIFSFPYLFFILFGQWKDESFKINAIVVGVILLVNISTLVMERRHFDLVLLSPYEQIMKEHQKAQQDYSGKVLSVIDSDHDISDYYIKKYGIAPNFSWQDTLGSLRKFSAFLNAQKQHYEYLYFGALSSSNPVLIPIIEDYFPNLVWQKNYCGGTAFLFSQKGNSKQPKLFVSEQDYERVVTGWNAGPEGSITDSLFHSGKHAYRMDASKEYGPSFSALLKDVSRNENNFIDISLYFHASDTATKDIMLVSSLDANKEPVDWRAAPFSDFVPANDSIQGWIKVHHSIKLSDIYLNKRNITLSVYIWNKAKKKFFVDDFKIRTRYGNPVVYGLFEKF